MATVKDMIKAAGVVSKLSVNPNVFISTSFQFLPLLDFLDSVTRDYDNYKAQVIALEEPPEHKEKLLGEYLTKEIEIPDTQIGVNSLRSCGLTMVELKKIEYWIVEFKDEYEPDD